MDRKSLNKIEFNKIIDMLREYITSQLGDDLLSQMRFYYEKEKIEYQQEATSEARYLITIANLSITGLSDIRTTLQQVEIKSTPSLESFVELFQTIDCYQKSVKIISKHKASVPLIGTIFSNSPNLTDLSDYLKRCVSPEGYILDNATPTLKSVRRQILNKEVEIRRKLDSIIQSNAMDTYLQEKLVTTRQGKYVIPVKYEHRSKVPGIIHDQSSSGATLFIEPQVVVEMSNQLRMLKQDERKEIDRILRDLTLQCYDQISDLEFLVEVMGVLDFLLARGHLSIKLNAVEPKINIKKVINLKNARHPLIPNNEVVPVSVKIGDEYQSLVITGPNTGGKTVTLKLIGLCQAMGQLGLHIPAGINSEISIFDNILADIGDEQSIEQSLSTFSSHMKNIIRLLDIATRDSLVLLDELGAGTDPVEGAALAMSIIDNLLELGSISISTTHYSELKVYAYNHPKLINGSVEFDVETLSPTYKLSLGTPGKSNAFLISEKLGLPKSIINKATDFLSSEQRNVEALIKDLERDRKNAEDKLAEAKIIYQKNLSQKQELEKKLSELKNEKKEIKRKANALAKEEVNLLKEELEETIEILKSHIENQKFESEEIENLIREARKTFQSKEELLKEESESFREKLFKKDNIKPSKHDDLTLEVGDNVYHKQWQREGYVVDISSDGKEVQVQCGQLKFWSDINLVEPREKEETKARRTSSVSKNSKNVPLELDIRGNTMIEAESIIDKYIDNAILNGRSEITIIHGKGTGALRKGVHELLEDHPNIDEFRLGKHDEGGHGVSVAKLK
ncbi:MAG: endonuclease MutS2 [Clostridia bacterium]